MWISRKTSEIEGAGSFGSQVGLVSVGGRRPAVITDGESRGAEILSAGGFIYVPKAGDEVLLERTCDEERIIVGTIPKALPETLSAGEAFIGIGGGSIHIKRNGDIEILGNIHLSGVIKMDGSVTMDGTVLSNGHVV